MKVTSYHKNKLRRKEMKYTQILLQELGINTCSSSKYLMVCNAGLVNGFQSDTILDLLSASSVAEKLSMFPGKSYCFIQFTSESAATNTYTDVHGKLFVPNINGPIYLLFVEKMPIDNAKQEIGKPNDLITIPEFLNQDEENILRKRMDELFAETGYTLKHRMVKHFGYEFDYKMNNVKKDERLSENIPDYLEFVLDRLKARDSLRPILKDWIPDQLTVNYYQPGQGIPSHVDTHSAFDDIIILLSIGSDIIMNFRNRNNLQYNLLLPRRSILLIANESRYGWYHGITPRKYDIVEDGSGFTNNVRDIRVSFTFRRVRHGECHCSYPELCDSQSYSNRFIITDELATKLEDSHVHQVYEVIGNHFSETRNKMWPNVVKFVNSFEPGSILLDVGCGNGKYLGIRADIFQMGCDRSECLTRECSARSHESIICDCLLLPFLQEVADGCICIAVIHHLATEKRRRQAVCEMVRVLRPAGRALIYVWAKDQRKEGLSSYLKQQTRKDARRPTYEEEKVELEFSTNQSIHLPVHQNRTQFKHDDLMVPWKLKKEGVEVSKYLRYYHVFQEEELIEMCQSIPEVKVLEYYYDQGNWCVILQKRDKMWEI